MGKKRKSLIGLAALTVLAGTVMAGGALAADVRFDATISVPNASVRISNIPCGHCGTYPKVAAVARGYQYYEIGKNDFRIARRISSFTGVPVREIIRLRRHGHAWFEIGRWLHMPRPAVRAAMSQKSWNRFLRDERMQAMYRQGRRERHRIEMDYGYGR